MEMPNSHRIPEQNTAYRRGMVLGLTLAEVGILIIFVLLLLIGLEELEKVVEREGKELVEVGRLQALKESESLLTQLRSPLQPANGSSVEEIRTLIRALQEVAATPEGQTTLKEARAVIDQMNNVREQIRGEGASEALANQIEQKSYRIANQEGQLGRYESLLKEAGLGKGERPCWVKPDGTIEYLYDIVLASKGIRMREYKYNHRGRERSLLPMSTVDPNQLLSPAEFLQKTQPLYNHSLAENCRFFVVIYDATGPTEKELYKRLLRTVEGHFYKRLDREPAPF